MSRYKPNQKIGLIQGGQLGRMLIQSFMDLGLQTHVMDKDPDAPCAHYATRFVVGDAQDQKAVEEFGKSVDILTLEFEHVNAAGLRGAQAAGVTVYPDPSVIEIIQDKGLQKQFFVKNGFPTAEFVLLESEKDIARNPGYLPGVQKLRRLGYDGRGVCVLKTQADVEKALTGPSVLEKRVDIHKEISVLTARTPSGRIAVYPAVEMVADPGANLLDTLVSPAAIPAETRREAEDLARKISGALGNVGLLAIEMFLDTSGRLLVNELAPRPHNSGHQTIEGNKTSQFEQHARAILDLPLGPTDLVSPAVMINLLGEPGHDGPPVYEGVDDILAMPGVHLHLYGKQITRPKRKMGHVTVLDDDINRAKETAQWVKRKLKVVT